MDDTTKPIGSEPSTIASASSLQELLSSTLSSEKTGTDYSVTIVKNDRNIVEVFTGESVDQIEKSASNDKEQDSEPALSFSILSRNWLDTCLGFMDAFPLYRAIAEIHQAQKVENDIERYLKRVAEGEPRTSKDTSSTSDVYTVDKAYSYEISRRIASLNRTKRAKATVSRGQLLVAIAEYEAFFSDLLRLIISKNPEAFIPSDAKISAQDVLRGADIHGLKESIIETRINSLQRESHVSQINYLYKVLKISLPDADALKAFGEICERRNLITHGNGVVNRI